MPQLAPRLSLRVSQNDNRVHVVLECEALFESYFTPAEADTITFFSGYVAGTPLLWGCIYSGAFLARTKDTCLFSKYWSIQYYCYRSQPSDNEGKLLGLIWNMFVF